MIIIHFGRHKLHGRKMEYNYDKENEPQYTEEELLYREGLIDQIKDKLDELNMILEKK